MGKNFDMISRLWIEENGSELLKERRRRKLDWKELFFNEFFSNKFDVVDFKNVGYETISSPDLDAMKVYDEIENVFKALYLEVKLYYALYKEEGGKLKIGIYFNIDHSIGFVLAKK